MKENNKDLKNTIVYLTFKTDKDTSIFLSEFAKWQGITQPELINKLCINFKENIIRQAKEQSEKGNADH